MTSFQSVLLGLYLNLKQNSWNQKKRSSCWRIVFLMDETPALRESLISIHGCFLYFWHPKKKKKHSCQLCRKNWAPARFQDAHIDHSKSGISKCFWCNLGPDRALFLHEVPHWPKEKRWCDKGVTSWSIQILTFSAGWPSLIYSEKAPVEILLVTPRTTKHARTPQVRPKVLGITKVHVDTFQFLRELNGRRWLSRATRCYVLSLVFQIACK